MNHGQLDRHLEREQRAANADCTKKSTQKPTNRAIYRPNLDFECGILRGKEESTSQKHFFFLTSGGRLGISWPPGLLAGRHVGKAVKVSAERYFSRKI